MASEHVFNVTAATFDTDVIARSQTVPVLLDFWAEWCGPCKTLRPTLDKLAEEYGGAFVLGAVDTEVENELAYAFQVQGIPFCVLIAGGRPVDAFQGALPEPEVRAFLAKAGIEPAGAPLSAEPGAAEVAVARAAIARGDWDAARRALAEVPEDAEAEAGRLAGGLDLLAAEIAADESPAAAAAVRGREAFLRGELAAAVEAWIESLEADRAWRAGAARHAAVTAFELLGTDERGRALVRELRGRMASVLY